MKHLVLTLALLPTLALAHNIKESAQVPLVNISDKGELVLKEKEISYQPWQSKVLAGKVFLIQHIAGRSSAKELNAPMIEAIKAAKLPHDKYPGCQGHGPQRLGSGAGKLGHHPAGQRGQGAVCQRWPARCQQYRYRDGAHQVPSLSQREGALMAPL